MEAEFYCTLVSILPFKLTENKPGLVPSSYTIGAALPNDFEITHIKGCFYPLWIDENRGSFQVPVTPDQLGKSLVDDYIHASIEVSSDADFPAHPGLFYVPGKLSKEDIKKDYADALADIRGCQLRWFKRLVQSADDDWAKFRQHKTISDLQRFAAKAIGVERDWLVEINDIPKPSMKNCPACYQVVHEKAVVCPACRCILDLKAYQYMQFAEEASSGVVSSSGSIS